MTARRAAQSLRLAARGQRKGLLPGGGVEVQRRLATLSPTVRRPAPNGAGLRLTKRRLGRPFPQGLSMVDISRWTPRVRDSAGVKMSPEGAT